MGLWVPRASMPLLDRSHAVSVGYQCQCRTDWGFIILKTKSALLRIDRPLMAVYDRKMP